MLWLLQQLPTLALADPLGIRLTVPSAPGLAPGTRQNLPPPRGTHPLARRRLQREGGEKAVSRGRSAVNPLPPWDSGPGFDVTDTWGVAYGTRPQAFMGCGWDGVVGCWTSSKKTHMALFQLGRGCPGVWLSPASPREWHGSGIQDSWGTQGFRIPGARRPVQSWRTELHCFLSGTKLTHF